MAIKCHSKVPPGAPKGRSGAAPDSQDSALLLGNFPQGRRSSGCTMELGPCDLWVGGTAEPLTRTTGDL